MRTLYNFLARRLKQALCLHDWQTTIRGELGFIYAEQRCVTCGQARYIFKK